VKKAGLGEARRSAAKRIVIEEMVTGKRCQSVEKVKKATREGKLREN